MFKKFPVFIVILFENQIQTTSTSPYRTQVQPAASFLVCSLIFIEYKSLYEKRNMFMKKLHRAFNVFSCFQTRKKGATRPNSLSHSRTREKRPTRVLIRFLVFKLMKKRSTLTSTRSLISRLVKKKDPTGSQFAFLF